MGSGDQTWPHTSCKQHSVWSAVDDGLDMWYRSKSHCTVPSHTNPQTPVHVKEKKINSGRLSLEDESESDSWAILFILK